jgi:uncharacterized membrane protein
MKLNWRAEIISLSFIATAFVFAVISWGVVPDRVAIHWNLAGEADGYGSKFYTLLLMPAVALGLYFLFLFRPMVDPRKENYKLMQNTYAVIRLVVVVYMSLFGILFTLLARGVVLDVGLLVPSMVGALLIIVGNYLGKLRPNWFAGIRTPWTLSSAESWNKTHQLGGKVFVGMGIGLILASVLGAPWAFITVAAGAFLGIAYTIYYSYMVWKKDLGKSTFPNAGQ